MPRHAGRAAVTAATSNAMAIPVTKTNEGMTRSMLIFLLANGMMSEAIARPANAAFPGNARPTADAALTKARIDSFGADTRSVANARTSSETTFAKAGINAFRTNVRTVAGREVGRIHDTRSIAGTESTTTAWLN